MLNFFRKHQRFFFIVVTVFVVISFSFFGTFSTMNSTAQVPDKTLGKAVDGSLLSSREVDALARFLASGQGDSASAQGGRIPNLLNDGVLKKEFIATGMGAVLSEKYFPALAAEFEGRLKKMKAFKPYVHPQTNYLSALEMWHRFVPAIPQYLAQLKAKECAAAPAAFELVCKLYLEQMVFPPELLKRFLSYQQSQYNWIQPDPELAHGNLGLFGFANGEDWFGPRYLELVSQCVINCAAIAKEKGYKVSDEEARADLLQNALQGLQQINPKQSVTYKDADDYFRQQVRLLGLDENSAAKLWRKVMLFRRFFHDVGNGVFLDPLAYSQFQAYAGGSAAIEIYQLPQELRLATFRDLLKLQVYLEAVAPRAYKLRALALPNTFATPDEVERRFPQLVQHKFNLEYAEVDKAHLAAAISLKETWEWELDESHWSALKTQFPTLAGGATVTREQRFQALEAFDKSTRLKVDAFACDQIMQGQAQAVEAALQNAKTETELVGVRMQGGTLPFKGVEDRAALLELLSRAGDIAQFSADGAHFYRIKVLEAPGQKEVLTFAEAMRDDTLDELLDKKLEDAYFEVRRKDPITFQTDDGEWKPFHAVKDQIGARLYADLLKAIEDEYRLAGGKVEQPSLDFFAANRLCHHMRQVKAQLVADDTQSVRIPDVIQESVNGNAGLETQWQLTKTTREIQRSDKTSLSKTELFTLPVGAWSSIQPAANGDLAFYRLEKHLVKEAAVADKVTQGQERLSVDARCSLMRQVLQLIADKDAIHLSEREAI